MADILHRIGIEHTTPGWAEPFVLPTHSTSTWH